MLKTMLNIVIDVWNKHMFNLKFNLFGIATQYIML